MKTILFAQPNSPLIQQLQNEGKEFILAKDPIKTLKAMKKLQKRGEYEILGDSQARQYTELAKKMGYQECKKPTKEDETNNLILAKTITILNEGYNKKLEEERLKLENDKKLLSEDYDKRVEALKKKHDIDYKEKSSDLEKEKIKLKKIKQEIKEKIYGE